MVIVVTGGIGSGKSEVCRMISSRYGFPVYSADSRVRRLYDEVPDLVDALESVLDIVLRDDSGLFRSALLAERIFSDHEALKKVEDMVFPYLISDFEDFHSKNPGNVVFESATVLEKEFFSDFGDAVWNCNICKIITLLKCCSIKGSHTVWYGDIGETCAM